MKRVIPTSFRSMEEPSLLRSGMTPAANDPERAENEGESGTDGQALAEKMAYARSRHSGQMR